jgi:hypothetical protein
MKTLLSILCLLGIMIAGFGQTFSISGVTTNPVSPERVQPGVFVTVNFSYTKPAGNMLLIVRPMYLNELASHYMDSGGVPLTLNSGSGTSSFSLMLPGLVDQLRFQFMDAAYTTVLHEVFADVSFRFVSYEISNLVFTPPPPASLAINEQVNFNYDYFKPAGDALIYLLPMYMGNVSEGYAVPGSPVYSATTGTNAGYVKMIMASKMDQIRFQFVDPVSEAVLFETFIPVNYMWVGYDIYNVHFSPESPAELQVSNLLTVNFVYSKPDGDVRIFAMPMFAGNPAENYSYSGSTLYTDNSGDGTKTMSLTAPGAVDQIRFQFADASGTTILAEIFVPVSFKWVSYQISNVVFSPPSPATIAVFYPVSISFSYTKIPGDVLISAMPMAGGAEAPGSKVSYPELYTLDSGTGNALVGLKNPGSVDQIRIRIMDPAGLVVLYETFYPVNYAWVNYKIADVVFSSPTPAVVEVNKPVGVTFNYTKPDGDIRIFVYGYFAGVMPVDYSFHGSPQYTANSGSGFSDFTLMAPGKIDEIHFLITNDAGTETFDEIIVPVDYTWTNYELTNVKFTPASPASLQPGEYVNTTFDYSKPDGDVRIFLTPFSGGSPAVGSVASAGLLYSANTGTGTGNFTVNQDGLVDQVRIVITDNSAAETVLFEQLAAVAFNFKNTSGIDDQSPEKGMSLYPVPCTDKLILVYPDNEAFQYRVYSLQGNLMIEGAATSGVVKVSTAGLPAGSYLVKVLTKGNVLSKIMVKQ